MEAGFPEILKACPYEGCAEIGFQLEAKFVIRCSPLSIVRVGTM